MTRPRPTRAQRTTLALLQAVTALGALPAGWAMITAPDVGPLGMPLDWLAASPFPDLLLPGLVLFILHGLVGVASALLAAAGRRPAGTLAAFLGAALIVWIGVQMIWVPFFFLQPLFLVVGLAELVLGLRLRAALRAPATPAAGSD